MKRPASVLIAILAIALAAAPALARPADLSAAEAGFEKVKSLAGDWQGKDPEGKPVTLTYKVISGGSAVMEEMSHGSMVTMYHLDGGHLMLTHYCEAKNQPRMRTTGLTADGKTLDFAFLDATNLTRPTDPHMVALTLTFKDPDHINQKWTYTEGGKDQPETFEFTRQK